MQWSKRKWIGVGFSVVLVINIMLLCLVTPRLNETHAWITNTEALRNGYKTLFIQLLNAETGQRGYLLTGRDDYNDPYIEGIRESTRAEQLLNFVKRDKAQQEFLDTFLPLAHRKLDELTRTVLLRRDKGYDAALTVVNTDDGLNSMKQVRELVNEFDLRESRRLQEANDSAKQLAAVVSYAFLFAAISFVSLIVLIITAGPPPDHYQPFRPSWKRL